MGYPKKRVTVGRIVIKGHETRHMMYRSWSDDSDDMSFWMKMEKRG